MASSGDNVTSAELGVVGEFSNWVEQSFPAQPLSQKHWFKFEQICGKHIIFITHDNIMFNITSCYARLDLVMLDNIRLGQWVYHLLHFQSILNYYDYWDI